MNLDNFLDELNESEENRGYKAMASSIGMGDDWKKVKSYMKSKEFKEKIQQVKKDAKSKDNSEAYIAQVERRILKGHFNK